MSYSRDEILLTIDNVTKKYGQTEVLSGVSAQIRDLHSTDAGRIVGQVVAFLGPSGVGKSQLLQIIAGLEPPTSGGVFLDGDKRAVRSGMVGVVFQRYPVWNHRKVLGNLMLAGELAGMTERGARARANEYLQMFDLSTDGDKYPAELSGGMQQRLAIARQLISLDGPCAREMRLLLMDEPFAALDPKNTRKVCKLIRSVADLNDKNTLVIVTHDLRAALSVADMVWVMGKDRDLAGRSTSGGKIIREIDLVERGLTWHPDIELMPEFLSLEAELAQMFQTL